MLSWGHFIIWVSPDGRGVDTKPPAYREAAALASVQATWGARTAGTATKPPTHAPQGRAWLLRALS